MLMHYRTITFAVTIVTAIGFTVMWLQVPTTKPVTVLPIRFENRHHAMQTPSRLLPHKYWEHRRLFPENYDQVSCSNLPRLEEIHYAAVSWQHLRVTNGSVYIYGAYWDDRFGEPLVRVLIYCDVTPLPPLMCQLWYEDENAPTTVPSTATYGWLPEWGGLKDRVNEPYVLACDARRHPPFKQQAAKAISIVTEDRMCGTPTNILNVQNAPDPDKPRPPLKNSTISVCLKWLQYKEDVSAPLVEWIELIKAFGANKLFVFQVKSHPNTRKVLDYYTASGFADVTEFMHAPQLRSNFSPGDQDFHDYRRELLPQNDCLYRSINKYQWMTPIDSDEIIVPHRHDTWQQIISDEVEGIEGLDALVFRNYYYLDGAQLDLAAPPYMKILGHLWRAREPNPPGWNVKSFHNTSSVVAMHNHYPMRCGVERGCWSRDVNETIARLHHYRSSCGDGSTDCPALYDIVRDDIVNKWSHIKKNVERIITLLGIKPSL